MSQYNPQADTTTGERLRSFPTVFDARTGEVFADSERLNQEKQGTFLGYERCRIEKANEFDELVEFEPSTTKQGDNGAFETQPQWKLNLAFAFSDPETLNRKDDGEPRRIVNFKMFTLMADHASASKDKHGNHHEGKAASITKSRESVGLLLKDILHNAAEVPVEELGMDESTDEGLQELVEKVNDFGEAIVGWEGNLLWQASRWRADRDMGRYKKGDWDTSIKPLRIESA